MFSLEVKNLSYERDDALLINNLSFSLKPGGFLYIAGDNGKGKTTLLKLLAGILRPTSGEIFFDASTFSKNKSHPEKTLQKNTENFFRHINYIGHKSAVALPLTPKENLYFSSRAYSLKSTIKEALAAVGLSHKENIPASFLSAGQVRRIALAKLFLLDTPLWLLDEPYTALDKHGVAWLQEQFHSHLNQGGMVIMTSHQAYGIDTKHVQEIYL